MNTGDKLLCIGVVAGVALAATFVATLVGTRARSNRTAAHALAPSAVESVLGGAQLAAGDEEDRLAEDAAPLRSLRAEASARNAEDTIPGGRRSRRSTKPEASYYAEFLAIGAKDGSPALEQAVRVTLTADSEPTRRKVAALSALLAAGTPHADDILAEAVVSLPDRFDAHSGSVPRCALRLLAERSHTVAAARATLESLVFDKPARLDATLRAVAVAGLAAQAPGAELPRLTQLLLAESDPCVFESAVDGLSENHDTDSAAALFALGVRPRVEPATEQ